MSRTLDGRLSHLPPLNWGGNQWIFPLPAAGSNRAVAGTGWHAPACPWCFTHIAIPSRELRVESAFLVWSSLPPKTSSKNDTLMAKNYSACSRHRDKEVCSFGLGEECPWSNDCSPILYQGEDDTPKGRKKSHAK